MSILAVIQSGEEARSLSHWAAHWMTSSGAENNELHLLEIRSQSSNPSESSKPERLELKEVQELSRILLQAKEAANSAKGEIKLSYWQVNREEAAEEILDFIHSNSIDLLLLGKQSETSDSDLHSRLSSTLFAEAPCQVSVLRGGASSSQECSRILVPCSTEISSKETLRHAATLAREKNAELVPILTRHGYSSDSEAIGKSSLSKLLRKAGIDSNEPWIKPRIVINKTLKEALSLVAEEGQNDLIMLQSPNEDGVEGLRDKLYTELSKTLLQEESGVIALRPAKALKDRLHSRLENWLSSKVPQLKRDDRVALFEQLETKSKWSFDFLALICLSTVIAALGLIQNSTPVVIGAMLVAPLMTPLLGVGLSLIQGNVSLVKDCLLAILLGFICALSIGVLSGFIAMPLSEGKELTNEILARGKPSLLDLGVAFFSGIAASYCVARPALSSALAGVAIAAALVPPIASCGIAFSQGDWQTTRGAALLFSTNVVAIILASALTFWCLGIRSSSKISGKQLWSGRLLIALIILCALLLIPLGNTLLKTLLNSN